MAQNITLFAFPVTDVEKAKIYYRRFLGVEPYVDSPYYVGYRIGEQEVGLDPNSTLGPIGYVDVDDIRSSLEDMTQVGAEIVQDVKDVGRGLLIAQIKDADGNVVGFRQQS